MRVCPCAHFLAGLQIRWVLHFYCTYFFIKSNAWPLVRIVSSRRFKQVVKHWIWWRNNTSRVVWSWFDAPYLELCTLSGALHLIWSRDYVLLSVSVVVMFTMDGGSKQWREVSETRQHITIHTGKQFLRYFLWFQLISMLWPFVGIVSTRRLQWMVTT